MYLPPAFAETRIEVLHEAVRAHPFGTLITGDVNRLEADHLPFYIDPLPQPFGTLRGHVARANPVWKQTSIAKALVIFQGPQCYVSPSSYPSKSDLGEVVPTWNYIVVHARGELRFIDDAQAARGHVEALTQIHEASRDNPWHVTDAPVEYIDRNLSAIVALELRVSEWVGKWKISQNRSDADQKGVIEALSATEQSNALAMAEEMCKRLK